jgi:ketosteroid isomerase-like protein
VSADVAAAFSRHEFASAYPHLAPDVRWEILGDRVVAGRDAVIAACTESAAYLAEVTTTFTRFRVVTGDGTVVVDTEARYTDPDGTTTVASCDLYDFADGRLVAIRSYTVALP